MKPFVSLLATALTAFSGAAQAANLSPGLWPKAERERLEAMEAQGWTPSLTRTVESRSGMVSATVSPIAVRAGVEALRQGGNAADAAATVALTQVTTQLGSVVSYAGIFTMLYYDARARRVYSMDAGYNSYLAETDPMTIPVGDLGPLAMAGLTPTAGAKGRETLVPGFMAGLESMHSRFGRLPFADLFAPALWYDEHGVRISPVLATFFSLRGKLLARTAEGRRFMAQSGHETPQVGDLFVQPDLALTLKAVARGGSGYMYAGRWGQDFVATIRREGGKVTQADLARYRPIWSEPRQVEVFGKRVYVNGPPHNGAYSLVAGLNLAEALGLDRKGPYWSDAAAFRDLSRIDALVANAPAVDPALAARLAGQDVGASPEAQLAKPYARAAAPLLDELFAPGPDNGPHHSNAIVVIDRQGNIAVVTHTINAVIWGDTGIVVGGVPIPDSAAFQQQRLASLKPGDRVPHEIIDTISFAGDRPVLATASIGSSMIPENLRVLVSILGQDQDLAAVMAAPPMLINLDPSSASKPLGQRPVPVPQDAYDAAQIGRMKNQGVVLTYVPAATSDAIRGTVAAVAVGQDGVRAAQEQAGIMVFDAAQ